MPCSVMEESNSMNGSVPKPAPLIEAIGPEVPEVSLLIQNKRESSFHCRSPHPTQSTKAISYQEQSNMLLGNHDSYNSWKAKHTNPLQINRGVSSGTDISPKHNIGSRKSSGIRRKQTDVNELHRARENQIGRPSATLDKTYTNQVNQHLEFGCNKNELPPQRYVHSCSQQHNNSAHRAINDTPFACDTSLKSNEYPHSRNMYHLSKEYQSEEHSFPPQLDPYSQHSRSQNMNQNRDGSDGLNRTNTRSIPEYTSNTNQGPCHCRQIKDDICQGPSNKELRDTNSPCYKNNSLQVCSSKLISPLDFAQINNQTIIDLYRIVNLQHEQILLLQQQVKQVLQMHIDCGKTPTEQKPNSYDCSCQQNQSTGSQSTGKKNNTLVHNIDIIETNSGPNKPSDFNYSPKRSVGVMTSSLDDYNYPNSEKNIINSQAVKDIKTKKQHKSQLVYSSLSEPRKVQPQGQVACNPHLPNHKRRNKKGQKFEPFKEEKRKEKQGPTCATKSNKEEADLCSQMDSSFSLNEADLVINDEQDDASPDPSMHIDLQDYYTSSESDKSEVAEFSSDQSEDMESGTEEEESSDPQLGWTFYNRVVGQVNNILKKTPARQEQVKLPGPQTYEVAAEYDAENNWSKRVTFDGPPLGDDDDLNVRQAPMHHQPRANGGPDRMQDFMMYNMANGNTNVSIATYGYLERYHLLPSQTGLKMPEHVFQGYQKNCIQSKKKSRHSKMYSHLPQQNQKRKSNAPSPKILDT